jgi:hypothetical protein
MNENNNINKNFAEDQEAIGEEENSAEEKKDEILKGKSKGKVASAG